nr:hypothetical protein BaRGS_011032 [Batillaria attramentaria]
MSSEHKLDMSMALNMEKKLEIRLLVIGIPQKSTTFTRNSFKLWDDDSIKQRLIVVFTFGDRQDRNIEEELRTVCKELKNVLNDASWRYVVFDNTRNNDMAVQKLLKMVQEIKEGLTSTVKLILAAMILSGLAFTACVVSEDTKGQVTEDNAKVVGMKILQTIAEKKLADISLKKSDQAANLLKILHMFAD